MGAAKKYFRKEFQKQMFSLEHDSPIDFYVSSVQANRSTVPLLLCEDCSFPRMPQYIIDVNNNDFSDNHF